MDKIICGICHKKFGTEDALRMHSNSKHPVAEKKSAIDPANIKKIRNWSITFAIVLTFAGLIWMGMSNVKTLPPVSMDGHIEQNPDSHVSRLPLPLAVQKHMLEHADGKGPAGIIINYNCDDYDCEPGLIEKLENFASDYPANVYVAPFPNMDAKIALTKLGKIQVLDNYDYDMISSFISGR